MPILNRLTMTAAATAIALAVPKLGFAETNMLFILDGSNSMWGQVEGVAKIKTAQDVLADLVADLPKDTKVGLMVYGHRSRESCDDIEILSSIGADGPAELVKKIRSIQPTGKTPIANALFGSLIAFSKFEGQNNHVVLISDGIETCGGDVCMAASAIANANIKPRVHVVGFDVGAKERAQLECIPKMGNGKYFSAANAGELKKAIAQVKQVAQAAPKPPQPKKKGPKEVFRDDFNGEELAEHWEVIRPNPDAFIVEDSNLLVITGKAGSIPKENVENLFLLDKEFPKGNWQITMRVKVTPQVQAETIALGIYHDKDNYILARPYFKDGGWNSLLVYLRIVSRSRGKPVSFDKMIWEGTASQQPGKNVEWEKEIKNLPQPMLVRLEKKGRSYVSMVKFEKAKKPVWIVSKKLTVLRSKGRPVIGYYSRDHDVYHPKWSGQGTIEIDWIKIETQQ